MKEKLESIFNEPPRVSKRSSKPEDDEVMSNMAQKSELGTTKKDYDNNSMEEFNEP